MADALPVSEVATELGTSRQTVLNLLHEGTLKGTKGQGGVWRVQRKSVDRFLGMHGQLNGRRRRKSAFSALRDEVSQLRDQVADLANAPDGRQAVDLLKERDDLRAQLVALEDALAVMREASDLQRSADAERSEMIEALIAALARSERADALHRQALEALEGGLARSLVPGHPGTTG